MSEYGNIVDQSSVRFERTLPGPIEQVWDYLVRREYLKTWLGDGDLGPRLGPFELRIEGPDLPHSTGAKIVGEVVRWMPVQSLGFTWNHLAPGSDEPSIAESLVEIKLHHVEPHVRLVLLHSRIDPSFTARLSTGWHVFLDTLHSRILGRPIKPAVEMFPTLLPEYERRLAHAK